MHTRNRAALMGELPDGHSSDQAEDAGLYALGFLRGVELATFETHLAACSVCRAIVDADLRTLRALGAAQPVPSLPPDFRERLLQRARDELGEPADARAVDPMSASPGSATRGWSWLVGLRRHMWCALP